MLVERQFLLVRWLRSFSTDTTSQLNIFRHDGNTFGVNGTQVGIFKQSDEVGLGGFLQGQDGRSLESQITLEILSNFTNQALKGQFSDQQIRRFLVTTNFPQSDSSWSVTMGLLDTSSGRGRFSGGLGGQLFTRGLASCRFTCCLLQ